MSFFLCRTGFSQLCSPRRAFSEQGPLRLIKSASFFSGRRFKRATTETFWSHVWVGVDAVVWVLCRLWLTAVACLWWLSDWGRSSRHAITQHVCRCLGSDKSCTEKERNYCTSWQFSKTFLEYSHFLLIEKKTWEVSISFARSKHVAIFFTHIQYRKQISTYLISR